MKKIMIMAIMLVAAVTAVAQDKNGEDMENRLFDAKLREMVYRLKLTDDQKAKFEPLYRDYDAQMRQTATPRDYKKDKKRAQDDNVTVEQEAAKIKERLTGQKKAVDIRLTFVDKFATVLDAKQLRQFFQVEKKMQEKLRHNPRGGNRGHGDGERGGDRGRRGGHGGPGPRMHNAGD